MRIVIVAVYLFFSSQVNSSSFSEVFGKEGESGIMNSKTRSLSYAFQYLTITGTAGYFVRKLYDNAFLGIVPKSLLEGSPLAYGNKDIIDLHKAKIIGVNQNVDKINYSNRLKEKLISKRYSFSSIEMRNNSNLIKSELNLLEREKLSKRYFND